MSSAFYPPIARLRQWWRAFLDQQHRLPSGLAGRVVGEKMVRQHRPETLWTLQLLRLRPFDVVLELGCGAGQGLALAHREVDRGLVVGIDRSATMTRAAAHRTRGAHRDGRAAVMQADLHALPVPEARFDKIFSLHTFYFWQEPEGLCIDLARLLAPGGRLVITLATAQQTRAGRWSFWPVHERVLAVVEALNQTVGRASLHVGPDSRQYNNVAIVVQA